jgi:glycosyltransferase involved in cell wall biosynthesis
LAPYHTEHMAEKKTILYIGNKLSRHGFTPTNIETLGPQLQQSYNVITTSHQKNKLVRLADIALTIIRHPKADVMLIDTYSTSAFRFAKMAGSLARRFDIPYIPILHGGNLPKKLSKATDADRLFFEEAFKLVAPSQYLFQQFQQLGLNGLVFIPNNIFLNQYPFKKRETIRPKLLWVRSFHKMYNATMALQVMRQLVQLYPDAELCMVGPDKDGSLDQAKRLAANFKLTDKIKFTGKLDRADWHKLSEGYDIFINTTTVDNTPVSVIEGLALGLPVISTNVGGIPYLLSDGENALLVPNADAEAMVAAIGRLVAEPGLAQRLSAGSTKLVQAFDWENVRHQWDGLFNEVGLD